jgi:hypothetical protein
MNVSYDVTTYDYLSAVLRIEGSPAYMEVFEGTKLWIRGLAERPNDLDKEVRDRLRSAFFDIRNRAGHLAGEIPRDLPWLTVHDLSHIDALWEMADLVVGDDLLDADQPFVTPAEAFVLGIAFVVHDLAHSRRAIPLADDELRATTGYRDIVAQLLSDRLGRPASKKEIQASNAGIHNEALGLYLRANHAILATQLPLSSWNSGDGPPQFLIQDEEIRRSFGEVAGKIAASHWMGTTELPSIFNTVMGAPGWLPPQWSCDPLKLACIIRCADAIHLDARRAPAFLRALRLPVDESYIHWDFQGRLYRPRREHDRLIFSSNSSFPQTNAESWWKCYEVVSGVSRELWSVDTLLAEHRAFKFAVRSVAGVEDVRLFSRYVKTEAWVPVDAQIKVSDVASLVERLGGKELYGDNVTVPLRELIQNGSDAVLARRELVGPLQGSECVKVTLMEREGQWILEVSDTGVGMSEEEMCGPLLDFGKSFWRSDQVRGRLPGLRASSFNPTGRYGIGFFSVFMLGSKVEVISRRFDAAANDTKSLLFSKGARSRPLLRSADDSERLFYGGTQVRVWLDKDPSSAGGFLAGDFNHLPMLSLADLCAWLCPSLPVDLQAKMGDQAYQTVVQANDWLSIDGASLLKRVLRPIPETETARLAAVIERNRHNVRSLQDEDGVVLGRGCILLQDRSEIDNKSDRGPTTVGGCRASGMHNFGGVLIGTSLRAARDKARPLIDGDPVREWATEQARLMLEICNDAELLTVGAAYIRSFGGSVARMPIV